MSKDNVDQRLPRLHYSSSKFTIRKIIGTHGTAMIDDDTAWAVTHNKTNNKNTLHTVVSTIVAAPERLGRPPRSGLGWWGGGGVPMVLVYTVAYPGMVRERLNRVVGPAAKTAAVQVHVLRTEEQPRWLHVRDLLRQSVGDRRRRACCGARGRGVGVCGERSERLEGPVAATAKVTL